MSARKLKIVLVSPKGPLYRHRGGIWKKSLRYQPLTLTTLAALIPPEIPVDLHLFDEGIADVPPIEIVLVDEDDPHVNDLGAKGIGEIGITGSAAAIANAVYHATGRRFRDLPIRIEDLLGATL